MNNILREGFWAVLMVCLPPCNCLREEGRGLDQRIC